MRKPISGTKNFRKVIQYAHSVANEMQRDLVPWDGREGLALNKLLAAKPKMT